MSEQIPPAYVVVFVDPECDFPGVDFVVGPFANYTTACAEADRIAGNAQVKRGEHVQVSMLEPPRKLGGAAARAKRFAATGDTSVLLEGLPDGKGEGGEV